MTASGPLSPGDAPPPGRPDPLSMSMAEKLACEWEARHDVMARGGRLGDPAALAHYITHTRCEDTLHGPGHPAGQHAHHHDAAHHDAMRHGLEPDAHLRSWVRWGEDRP